MKMKEIKDHFTTKQQLDKIYDHNIRNMIVQLLNMYRELSLSQLSKILNKNKTTIQYHVAELRNNNIVQESRISHEDSRGSIPTKYYKLNPLNLDYHLDFAELQKISDFTKRIEGYKKFLYSLKICITNLQNLLTYAEEGVESSLKRINILENDPEKLSNEAFAELDGYIRDYNSSISIFSTAKSPFLEMKKLVPEMFHRIEKIEADYYMEEKKQLKGFGKSDDEIKSIFQNKEEYTEGYQVITILHPLKNLIEAKLENEN
ncbi:MAG: winged helix-turn-helix domain-containing protein [Candidatus Hodarchaeota archaeon]